jgi:preprotein translocase subunit SecG
MMGFLLFIEVVVSVLLIIVILLQRSKSGGMGTALGGGVGESLFGVQAGNVLTRITSVLVFIFLFDATLLAWMSSGRQGSSVTDAIPESAMPAQQQMPMAQQPGATAGQIPKAEGASSSAADTPSGAAPVAEPASTVSLSDIPAKADSGMGSVAAPADSVPASPVAEAPAKP